MLKAVFQVNFHPSLNCSKDLPDNRLEQEKRRDPNHNNLVIRLLQGNMLTQKENNIKAALLAAS